MHDRQQAKRFEQIAMPHLAAGYNLARWLTRNDDDAEDVVQESFLRAYRQLSRFEARANFGTWLYRITANCAVDMMRARQARRDQSRAETLEVADRFVSDAAPGPDRLAASAEIDRRIGAAMARLSPLERAAFTLRHYEGRTIDEISRMLGLRTNAAKHSVFRAVRKLRAALAAEAATATHRHREERPIPGGQS